nr:hypothetical protein [uncultured Roseateles sp.]
MSKWSSFIKGYGLGQRLVGDYRQGQQNQELQAIADERPVTVDGYSPQDGQQLEAIANAKDAQGNPLYTIGTDENGKYTVAPTQGGAGGEAGVPVQLPTQQRTQFLGQTYDQAPDAAAMTNARTMAMAGVMKKFGNVSEGQRLEQQAQQGQREDKRFGWEQSRAARDQRLADKEDEHRAALEAVDKDVADWSAGRLAKPDGTLRDMTIDDQLAASQYRVSKLVGAGKLSEANALAKDNMQIAGQKIQLQTAERNEALAKVSAAVASGDLTGLEKFYETYVPDGANITGVTQDPKTGKITIERETLDGRKLPSKVAKDANEILAGLKTFQDPMALYNFSQSEFARNLQVKADKRADAQLGVAQAAGGRAQAEFDAGAPERNLKGTVATLQLGLANATNPAERQAIQDKLTAVQGGLGMGKDQPSEVKLAGALLKAGVASDMRGALEMAVTKRGKNPEDVHQEFVTAGTKNLLKPAEAVKQADELMSAMGYAKKGGRWGIPAASGSATPAGQTDAHEQAKAAIAAGASKAAVNDRLKQLGYQALPSELNDLGYEMSRTEQKSVPISARSLAAQGIGLGATGGAPIAGRPQPSQGPTESPEAISFDAARAAVEQAGDALVAAKKQALSFGSIQRASNPRGYSAAQEAVARSEAALEEAKARSRSAQRAYELSAAQLGLPAFRYPAP